MSKKLTQQAVALKYTGSGAPQVTAKGFGHIGQKIIDIALENGIPIQENSELVGLLSQVELEDEIPQELYVAVAEVLNFIYSIKSPEWFKAQQNPSQD